MCVIIYKPKDVEIPENLMARCFEVNPHGAGFVYKVKGNLVSQKGFFDFEELWAQIKHFQAYQGVIHCRWASAGKINKFFCHPFPIKKGFLFHNGHIEKLASKTYSDTYVLSRMIKAYNPHEVKSELKKLSKVRNRFCVFTRSEISLFGEWTKFEGLTFSNMLWRQKPQTKNLTECHSCKCINLASKYLCASCGSILNWTFVGD